METLYMMKELSSSSRRFKLYITNSGFEKQFVNKFYSTTEGIKKQISKLQLSINNDLQQYNMSIDTLTYHSGTEFCIIINNTVYSLDVKNIKITHIRKLGNWCKVDNTADLNNYVKILTSNTNFSTILKLFKSLRKRSNKSYLTDLAIKRFNNMSFEKKTSIVDKFITDLIDDAIRSQHNLYNKFLR